MAQELLVFHTLVLDFHLGQHDRTAVMADGVSHTRTLLCGTIIMMALCGAKRRYNRFRVETCRKLERRWAGLGWAAGSEDYKIRKNAEDYLQSSTESIRESADWRGGSSGTTTFVYGGATFGRGCDAWEAAAGCSSERELLEWVSSECPSWGLSISWPRRWFVWVHGCARGLF